MTDTDQLGAEKDVQDMALPHDSIAVMYFPLVREKRCKQSGPGAALTSQLSCRDTGGVKWG